MLLKIAIACVCVLQVFATIEGKKQPKPPQDVAQLCRLKLYSPENGRIEHLVEVRPGEFTASFKCNPGYRMIGEEKISCKEGHWASRVPWCKSLCNFVECGDGQKCIVDEKTAQTKCICKNIYECPFEYKPICGSNHVTYASTCIMGMSACMKRQNVTILSDGVCPKEVFEDSSCGECPRIRICPALYSSKYAFLGKLKALNQTEEGIYLTFQMYEVYKMGGLDSTGIKSVTVFKKKQSNDCNCIPFVPQGRAYIFGQVGFDSNGRSLPVFDEQTFVEKFYAHKQMSLCWLY